MKFRWYVITSRGRKKEKKTKMFGIGQGWSKLKTDITSEKIIIWEIIFVLFLQPLIPDNTIYWQFVVDIHVDNGFWLEICTFQHILDLRVWVGEGSQGEIWPRVIWKEKGRSTISNFWKLLFVHGSSPVGKWVQYVEKIMGAYSKAKTFIRQFSFHLFYRKGQISVNC